MRGGARYTSAIMSGTSGAPTEVQFETQLGVSSRGWASSRLLVWPLIVLIFFGAIAPTLSSFEFYFGSEAVNVATALEIRRTGRWLMPTLQGEPRLAKPPLTGWITALAIRESTIRDLSSTDSIARARAYERLAWDVRWPGLFGACVMLVAVYEIGRAVGGARVGIVASLVAGSTIMFMRQSRLMQTDLQLAIWVTVANAFLANAILRRTTWTNVIGAGVALGLGILAKGPIALLMTIAPAGAFLLWRRERIRFDARWLIALTIMLLVGAWWYAWVLATHPGGWRTFIAEATRYGANTLDADKWSKYLVSLPRLFLPWTPLLVIGIVIAVARAIARRGADAIVLPLFILVVPLLVMICFKERKERYLTPLLAPGAVLCALGVAAIPRLRGRAILVAIVAAGTLGWNLYYCRELSQNRDGQSIMKPLADAAFAAHPDANLNGYATADTQATYLLVPGAETSIYLNQAIRWTRDPSTIIPTDRPQFLLVVKPEGVKFSAPEARWQLLVASVRRDVTRQIWWMPPAK
jgi:4-amino-4-deoxy-L-arabinose transferase-like glycosyltransferase